MLLAAVVDRDTVATELTLVFYELLENGKANWTALATLAFIIYRISGFTTR